MENDVIQLDTATEQMLAAEDGTSIDVYCWRLEQLLYAGYSSAVADALAADPLVDLHLACELLERGCPEATAYRIVS